MELVEVAKILWVRRVWFAVVVALACLVALAMTFRIGTGGVQLRPTTFGVAEAEFIVDSPQSFLIDLTRDPEQLATRAQVYTQFMRSNGVRNEIARRAGVDPELIVLEGLYTIPGRISYIPRPAAARSNEIRGEHKMYRLTFDSTPSIPIVAVHVQAPTAVEAIKLADATVAGVRARVAQLERDTAIPKRERTHIFELSSAAGGTITTHARWMMAALGFVVALAAGCMLIIGFDAVLDAWRRRPIALRRAA